MEQWKDIPNYEGYYQISNKGRIKTLKRITSNYYKKTIPERIRKPQLNTNGRYKITLSKEGLRQTHFINTLLAQTFT